MGPEASVRFKKGDGVATKPTGDTQIEFGYH